jgi:hypothetical protein
MGSKAKTENSADLVASKLVTGKWLLLSNFPSGTAHSERPTETASSSKSLVFFAFWKSSSQTAVRNQGWYGKCGRRWLSGAKVPLWFDCVIAFCNRFDTL